MRRGEDREAKNLSRLRSGWASKGAVNLIEIGTMSCKSRTALNVCRDRAQRSWTGYHRCHGEACVLDGTRAELSVGYPCMDNNLLINSSSCSVNRTVLVEWSGVASRTSRRHHTPSRWRPGLPGTKLSTYRIKGSPREHGNLMSSAGPETASKPPSPARSRLRGGAFVVVGVREIRAQGEGRQSMSMAASPLG